MKVIVSEWHTDIFPTNVEVQIHCKPGSGAGTCSWLTMGAFGWCCYFLHKSAVPSISKRREEGTIVAMRDGCKFVKSINPCNLGLGTFEL